MFSNNVTSGNLYPKQCISNTLYIQETLQCITGPSHLSCTNCKLFQALRNGMLDNGLMAFHDQWVPSMYHTHLFLHRHCLPRRPSRNTAQWTKIQTHAAGNVSSVWRGERERERCESGYNYMTRCVSQGYIIRLA